ncbi:pentatricopeptide repeat-containing protein At1g01970 [Amaranthus tricolor]|uniref:pentatricopeptide repeat-containing protein At1g01970 n=1 Tax=Amaranthus tricolor TaxID=29722 RepID=UPI0025883445|nr:pentatricopeptide repeat-containing protein At1g01970 [Amaranthus tricolor]
MACSSCHLFSHPFTCINDNLVKNSRIPEKPTNFVAFNSKPRLNSAVSTAKITGNVQEFEEAKERPKFRWVEINPGSITESQKLTISQLPRKMERRCKALMRQIICFSPQKGSLSELLSAWVKIMKPRRADWLAVLKELSYIDHPFFMQVSELALLDESFEANIRDYTKMIHLYAKHDRLQDAANLLLEMSERGLTCDQVTLTTITHMYSKAGHFKLAEETFEEMKLLGQPLDKRSYGAMIMAYIRAGMPDKGEALIKEMEQQEIYAGREVYKSLLRTYSMQGDCDGAQRVFDAIQVAGVCPDIKFCGLLINAYVEAGQSQKARVAFDNMKKAGIEPNDKSIALLLSAYEKEKRINTAMEFLIHLEKEGIMIGKEASELLVNWFRKLGVAEEVSHVLKEYAGNETTF